MLQSQIELMNARNSHEFFCSSIYCRSSYQACDCKNLKLAEKFLPFWVDWLIDWLNIVMSLFLVIFKNIENFSINPTYAKVCTERPPPLFPKYFLDKRFCFAKYAIISQKIDEICDELNDIFVNDIFQMHFLFIYLFS